MTGCGRIMQDEFIPTKWSTIEIQALVAQLDRAAVS